jgi:hypothetical protein
VIGPPVVALEQAKRRAPAESVAIAEREEERRARMEDLTALPLLQIVSQVALARKFTLSRAATAFT